MLMDGETPLHPCLWMERHPMCLPKWESPPLCLWMEKIPIYLLASLPYFESLTRDRAYFQKQPGNLRRLLSISYHNPSNASVVLTPKYLTLMSSLFFSLSRARTCPPLPLFFSLLLSLSDT